MFILFLMIGALSALYPAAWHRRRHYCRACLSRIIYLFRYHPSDYVMQMDRNFFSHHDYDFIIRHSCHNNAARTLDLVKQLLPVSSSVPFSAIIAHDLHLDIYAYFSHILTHHVHTFIIC